MRAYDIPLVPGPTSVPPSVLAAYNFDYGSGDLEEDFYLLYEEVQDKLGRIVGTANPVVIMSGEAMVVLWGALKSCLQAGDTVLAIGTGVFGYGIGDMARFVTDRVYTVEFEYDQVADVEKVEQAIVEHRPQMVTAVHCETPSGTLNPVAEIGQLIARHGGPLFYVDAVSSAAGAPLRADDWHIDLCLVGTQKCLSALPDLGILSVSERAWESVEEVKYQGYEALAPWRTALAARWFPYTPDWHATAALDAACDLVLSEGLPAAIERHATAARYCRERALSMGLELYPQREEDCSPTVTALKVPAGIGWEELDRRLRAEGMVVGGSLGPLAGKVFRIGHMGTQADVALLEKGMDVLERVVRI